MHVTSSGDSIVQKSQNYQHLKQKEDFQRCFNQWKTQWNKCTEYQMENLEEN